jgi:uncharacterized protein (DUF433 family)
MENWQNHIEVNPSVRSGKPCIVNTRITVSDILYYLAAGMSFDEIIEDFPQLNHVKISAALSFAAYREKITKISMAS